MIEIKNGLDLPIGGRPEQRIEDARRVRNVALIGDDYPGMKPTMAVRVGDSVKRGQLLFTDKKNEGVRYTAPAAGTVSGIYRGEKRVLQSVVIEVGDDAAERLPSFNAEEIGGLTRASVIEHLMTSGLWTSLRTRPYSKVPKPATLPHSVFVTAMDTNPLAADPVVVIENRALEFALGLDVVAKLTEGEVFVCQPPGKYLPSGTDRKLVVEEFAGIHPAGLPGTHIHFLDSVSANKTVWFINYQDVIAIGASFQKGELVNERVVSLAGPGVQTPRLLRTVLGASLEELTAGELGEGELRIISGSVLAGRAAHGPWAYLGRYHSQVSVLAEDRRRRMFGYLTSGFDRHSVMPSYISKWIGRNRVKFTTSTNGSPRAMVPIGTYERVMALDILPTQLLRSLLTGDIEMAINLGCLELDEDDIALCTYACPSKYEYGPILRDVLTTIEKEG